MLRAHHALSILVLALAPLGCAPTGCAGTGPDPNEGNSLGTEEAMSAGGATLAGTYQSDAMKVGSFAQLVLMTDGTYHGARVVACIKAPCPPIGEDGGVRLYARDGHKYMALTDASSHIERYEYALRDGTLRMQKLGDTSGEWLSMQRSTTAWCAESNDCAMQALPVGPCAGTWQCAREACNWSCGQAPKPEER
jgi:hypothetical protein